MIYIIRHKIVHKITFLSMALCIIGFSFNSAVYAQPYGKGTYGANVPYGSQTSLSIATGADVSIQITPDDNGVIGTGNNIVTVTSTDVVGYTLYIRSLTSSDMTNGPAVLPASANITSLPLAVNTWGYNTSGSGTNFIGMTASNVLVKSASGPFSSGDPTTFTYGVKLDNQKPAGNYVTSVVYTAAPQTD
ncbi:MAG: hypothetical protein NTX11_02155 [Candidatus Saccharibacteria bacterium]|nr:hypothetical protein [Candidatus Saccharibacteria bacterium]